MLSLYKLLLKNKDNYLLIILHKLVLEIFLTILVKEAVIMYGEKDLKEVLKGLLTKVGKFILRFLKTTGEIVFESTMIMVIAILMMFWMVLTNVVIYKSWNGISFLPSIKFEEVFCIELLLFFGILVVRIIWMIVRGFTEV